MSGGGYRVQIPNSVRKTIQNIKEITGNHSEEEIYAMLKECSMDPNETAQRLLFQDPFHEVKSKRDKRKDNLNNRESAESRWRATTQGRGSRDGRAKFSTRHASNGSGRNSGAEKSVGPYLPVSQETGSKEATLSASSPAIVSNGRTVVASGSTGVVHSTNFAAGSGINQPEKILSTTGINESESALPPVDADKSPSIAFAIEDMGGEPVANSSNSSLSTTSSSSSAVCFSSLDPVLVSTSDSRLPGAVGAIKREVGSNQTSSEQNSAVPAETKLASASEIGGSLQGKMPSSRSEGDGKNPMLESSQPSSSSTHGSSSGSRPSSNYSNRSQAIFGPQKVGSNKEWKPKSIAPGVAQGSGTGVSSDVASISIEASAQSLAVNVLDSEEATSELQKKLEELHIPQRQHVIIPNHIHVPESERTKLSFGSFDASFGVTSSFVSAQQSEKSSSFVSAQQSEKSSTPMSETSHGLEEPLEDRAASPNALATAEEGTYPEHTLPPLNMHDNFSGEQDVSSSVVQEFDESKQESALSGGYQDSAVHTSPNYNYGFMPPIIGSQASTFENSESQAPDVSRFPSFVVQQPFDPASYYAQFYRSGADSDGRVSPFATPAVATKYNGNVAVLPPQNSQSPPEGGNLVLSAAGPTPLVTQAAGLMQSSLAAAQQPLPVFRPPAGLHISPYPPNYFPYGHYYSPLYVPPPGIHQFLTNGGFPQQPQAGGVYPAPPAAASGIKYPVPQYKSATNSGNSTQIGVPSGYGPYSSSPAGCNPSAAATAGNSGSNEDLATSQFKENNVYISGQQSEGSAVWIAGPSGRDISSLPTSFYNLPQAQHMTFAQSQAGHGTFAGIYHPAQAVTAAGVHPLLQQSQTIAGAVDMVGPTANAYQQPQHAQINWPSNY